MKIFYALCLAFFCVGSLIAQPNEVPQEVIDDIKNDIWIPFMQAYRDTDAEKLKSIHTWDIMRITIDDNSIETGATYLENFGGFIESIGKSDREVAIAFSILSTAVDEHLAYQTGYYRFSSKEKGEEEFTVRGYGFFNVALRNEVGTWKISMDSDKRADIDEEEFRRGGMVYELE